MPVTIGPFNIRTKYSKGAMDITVSHYHYDNNQPALSLRDHNTGEPILTASVMMEGAEIDEDCVFIKAWSENEGVDTTLIRCGLISEELRSVRAGFCVATMHKMQGDLLDAWKAHKAEVGL